MSEIKRLETNYKTDESLENFRALGSKDLYMVSGLGGQMIDTSSDLPFYGIFVGGQLGARMALLKKGDVEEIYFPDSEDYILLWKLEALPKYQNRRYVSELVDLAKSFSMPVKAIGRNNPKGFFLHHGFIDMKARNMEGHDVLLWKP